ncbi:hypothetical protein Q4610_03280 [Sphingobium sp. HBC34]|uniref:Glycerophosphoryl diester phosphodiesterase membrane domain-containing protein n=1 Tax=Sphingobium cyanobacteriorum TaxID=3063954 RepID=A0ABT8ZHQ3_9SPHN|nr:hypothetical protein [Sphingobium sp. HBC34]MDO7834058.1 hypothetical protein [Sphingobium sp. HBC34]
MATMSIGKAWQDSLAFIKREGHLLFPVALLFLSVPLAIVQQMVPANYMQMQPGQTMASLPPLPAGASVGILLGAIVMVVGSLSVYALALRPGISVAEAIRLALSRLPMLIGASMIVGLALMVALFAVAMVGGLLAAVIGKAGGVQLSVLLMTGVLLYIGARLVPLSAVVIDRRSGVIMSVRAALALTKGQVGRMAAFLMISMILIFIVQLAVQSAVGVVATLALGKESGRSISDLAVALTSGVLNVYLLVLTARIYRQLEEAAA